MNAEQRAELFAMRKALDGFVKKIADSPSEINENPAAIRRWQPGAYDTGDVRAHEGVPYRCVSAHDSADNAAWTPDTTPALWTQYHGTSKATARPWIAPTGAQDVYRAGEWMIWTDGLAWPCIADTNFSPAEYAAAWGAPETINE